MQQAVGKTTVKQRATKPGAYLSPCAAAYALSLADPFTNHGIGVPCMPTAPSLKTWAFARGEFSTGTAQFGYILISPRDLVASDRDSIWHSTSAYAGTVTAVAGVGVTAVKTNSPYAQATFTASDTGTKYRLVSVGLRIRYSGTALNRGGYVLSLHHAGHNDLNGVSYATADGFNTGVRNRPKDDWITVLYCPILTGDYDYLNAFPTAYRFMAHFCQAPGGTTSTYEYEVFVNYEVNGFNIRGMTHTMTDPVGMAAVGNALQGTQMVHTNEKAHTQGVLSRVWSALTNGVSEGIHTVIDGGIKSIESSAKNWAPLALEAGAALLV